MFNSFFSRLIYIAFLLLLSPALASAKQPMEFSERKMEGIITISFQDSIKRSKPEDKKPEEVKTDIKKPDIKEVPKARPKLKPRIVTDRIKIKPVRIPRPKIIKRLRPIL